MGVCVARESPGSQGDPSPVTPMSVCLGRQGEGSNSSRSWSSTCGEVGLHTCRPLRDLELGAALQDFRDQGAKVVGAGSGPTRAEQWRAACSLVDGLLSGVQAHLPTLKADVRLTTAEGEKTSVALTMRFAKAPVVGDIATRSRVGYQLYLSEELTFSVREQHGDALVLHVCGLAFVPLKEVGELRERLKVVLGKDFSPASTYAWWENHKEEFCPLKSSKLRWVIESILGLRSAQAVTPQKGKEKMLWGMMHTRTLVMEGFSFLEQGKDGVRVTSLARPPSRPAEAEMETTYAELIAAMPAHELSMGEYFMPSSMNWLRLNCSEGLRQPGADPAKIRKLFSAARVWGPGKDGWCQWDDTWLCVDCRDSFGRVHEQGRTVWRLPDADAAESAKPPESSNAPRFSGPRGHWHGLLGLGGQ